MYFYISDWYATVQALSVFGFVGINVAFLVLTLQIFSSICKGVSDLGFWNALCCFVTGKYAHTDTGYFNSVDRYV